MAMVNIRIINRRIVVYPALSEMLELTYLIFTLIILFVEKRESDGLKRLERLDPDYIMRTWLSGRVLASQAEDREFESRRPLHKESQGVQVSKKEF